jgi:hypothetical protein
MLWEGNFSVNSWHALIFHVVFLKHVWVSRMTDVRKSMKGAGGRGPGRGSHFKTATHFFERLRKSRCSRSLKFSRLYTLIFNHKLVTNYDSLCLPNKSLSLFRHCEIMVFYRGVTEHCIFGQDPGLLEYRSNSVLRNVGKLLTQGQCVTSQKMSPLSSFYHSPFSSNSMAFSH